MLRQSSLEQQKNLAPNLGNQSMAFPTYFCAQIYPKEQRKREARVKKIFGILNGIGWAATFVGGLTLTGIGTLGMGTKAIIALSSATVPVGTTAGFFVALDEIKETKKQEKELINSINQQLLDAKNQQLQLLADLFEAENFLIIKLKELAAELNLPHQGEENTKFRNTLLNAIANEEHLTSSQQKKFNYIVNLTEIIRNTAAQLIPIGLSQPIKFKNETFASKDFNHAILASFKLDCASLDAFCLQPRCQQIITEQARVEAANKPFLMINSPAQAPKTSNRFLDTVKSISKKVFSAGYGAGIGFGIGTIFCGLALATSPPGWAILATLAGIAVVSVVVGVITYRVEQRFKARHNANMQRLRNINTQVVKYKDKQSQCQLELQKSYHQFKEHCLAAAKPIIEEAPRVAIEFRRRANSCSSQFFPEGQLAVASSRIREEKIKLRN